jgi:hypothetical protein
MSRHIEDKLGSTIYARINELHMTEAQRNRAVHALYEANLLVDGIVWVAKKIEQWRGRLFLKPALKN